MTFDPSKYFPLPTTVDGLYSDHPTQRTAHGSPMNVLNRQRWYEIARDRADHCDIVARWGLAAVADGWEQSKLYSGEPLDRACRLYRDGFSAQVICRRGTGPDEPNRNLGIGEIHIWGPDGLQIVVPLVYPGWEYFPRSLFHCSQCHRVDRPTVRVSFAGRVCEECLPSARAVSERPGWDN